MTNAHPGEAVAENTGLVVPTLNAGNTWEKFRNALGAQRFLPRYLLAVDSASSDGTPERARTSGFEVWSIPRDEFDHGGTRWRAIERLPGASFIIFLTQDSVLADSRSLELLVRGFSDPLVGAIGGRQIPREGAGAIESHARLFNYPPNSRIVSLDDTIRLGIKAAFLSDSFSAYRKNALAAVGGFPERVILGEDMIVAARMLLKGWKIAYSAESTVYHSHSYTLVEEFRRYFDTGVLHARESWIRKSIGKPEGEGVRFLRSEAGYLLQRRPGMIPWALARNAVKYLAYLLGTKESRLPGFVKKWFSMNRGYWKQREMIEN